MRQNVPTNSAFTIGFFKKSNHTREDGRNGVRLVQGQEIRSPPQNISHRPSRIYKNRHGNLYILHLGIIWMLWPLRTTDQELKRTWRGQKTNSSHTKSKWSCKNSIPMWPCKSTFVCTPLPLIRHMADHQHQLLCISIRPYNRFTQEIDLKIYLKIALQIIDTQLWKLLMAVESNSSTDHVMKFQSVFCFVVLNSRYIEAHHEKAN